MKKPLIEFQNFSFQYFSQAEPTLHNIDLTIYEGEKVLIVGERKALCTAIRRIDTEQRSTKLAQRINDFKK